MADFEKIKAERKERARQMRREAYQKLKNSPAMLERKAKLKEMRKAANERFKAAKKIANKNRKAEQREIENDSRQQRDEQLMKEIQLQSEQIRAGHLRLVKDEND